MRARLIVIPIDDIARLFKDYTYLTGFPEDAVCDTLMFNPATGDMCLRVASETWDHDQPPETIRFDLKQSFMVS